MKFRKSTFEIDIRGPKRPKNPKYRDSNLQTFQKTKNYWNRLTEPKVTWFQTLPLSGGSPPQSVPFPIGNRLRTSDHNSHVDGPTHFQNFQKSKKFEIFKKSKIFEIFNQSKRKLRGNIFFLQKAVAAPRSRWPLMCTEGSLSFRHLKLSRGQHFSGGWKFTVLE